MGRIPDEKDIKGIKGYKAELPLNPSDPTWLVNYLLNLINLTTYLLKKQIESLEEKFIHEGDYTENLFKRRLRRKQRIYETNMG